MPVVNDHVFNPFTHGGHYSGHLLKCHFYMVNMGFHVRVAHKPLEWTPEDTLNTAIQWPGVVTANDKVIIHDGRHKGKQAQQLRNIYQFLLK